MAEHFFDENSCEAILNKATNPLNRDEDWEYIISFCDKVNAELEGVQVATKLLLYKLKSPQEKEALHAATVLDACVKNCGELFQNALGKSSFIDELVSIISQQHVKALPNQKLQEKLIKLLYIWSFALPAQTNIANAYQKLKKQGICRFDPYLNPSDLSTIPSIKSKKDLFSSDEEKRIQLQKLLKSKNPSDLQAANFLIKNAVQEEEQKMEKVKKHLETLEEVGNNVALLEEMLRHYDPGQSAAGDLEMIKEIATSCSNFRSVLFQAAAEGTDEEMVAEVLEANDLLSKALSSYENAMKKNGSTVTEKTENMSEPRENPAVESTPPLLLLDMYGMNLHAETSGNINKKQSDVVIPPHDTQEGDDTLIDLHSSPSEISNHSTCLLDELTQSTSNASLLPLFDQILPEETKNAASQIPKLNDLDDFGDNLIKDQQIKQSTSTSHDLLDVTSQSTVSNALTDINLGAVESQVLLPLKPSQKQFSVHTPDLTSVDYSLDKIHVSLNSIRPSNFPFVTFYDKNNLRLLLMFAKDHAQPSRPDTLVCVVTMNSTCAKPIRSIHFQVAAPKTMKVKLQCPSATETSAFNPLVSTPPLTQILIISNQPKETVILRYKLSYNINMQDSVNESGLITGFPPPEKWGKL